MSKIFLSFVEEDTAVALALATGLEAAGYSTWHYKRTDTPAGTNYFLEIRDEIGRAEAVVFLISPQSVKKSAQVDREIVRASETNKPVFPVLLDLTYKRFQQLQPAWTQALGATKAVEMSADGIAVVLPRIVQGLVRRGIEPDRATKAPSTGQQHVVLLYKRNAHPDEDILKLLERELAEQGHDVFIDRHLRTGMEWASEIQRQVRSADAVIPLLSVASMGSEMLEEELRIAHETAQRQGKPRLLPVRVNYEGPLPDALAGVLNPIQYSLWKSPEDNSRLVGELTSALRNPPKPRGTMDAPAGGAVPLDDEFYIVRPTDLAFSEALTRGDSIVLVKGARQMGKSSLLARGLQQARQAGARVALTDFQKLNADDLNSLEHFFRALAELVAERLDLDVAWDAVWKRERSPSINLERFIRREVLAKGDTPLVWGMDEVDRLFVCPFATEVFGLFRSWHNERSLDPEGPWRRLTLAIVYATEAHLFINDLNQSPFNVGTRLALEDFTLAQVAELNGRYGGLLRTDEELRGFFQLLGGNPYFVRRGFQELKKPGVTLATLEAEADRDEGPFGDHLRRILVLLAKDESVGEAVRQVLRGTASISEDSFYRLRSAGVMVGESSRAVRPRCQVYATFLRRHLL